MAALEDRLYGIVPRPFTMEEAPLQKSSRNVLLGTRGDLETLAWSKRIYREGSACTHDQTVLLRECHTSVMV